MKTVGAFEAKTHLSRLLQQVENLQERIIIERRGKKIAMLIPYEELENQEKEKKRIQVINGFQEIRAQNNPSDDKMHERPKELIKSGRKR